MQIRIDGLGGFAIESEAKIFDRVGDHFVSFIFVIKQNIVHCLRTDDLTGRGHKRYLPQVLSHFWQLGKDGIYLVKFIHGLKLVYEI